VWDDAPWRGFDALRGDVVTDVCVVGLGGSGLAAIDRLLELGQRVVGIDAGRVAGGAAGRNGGFLLAGAMDFYHDATRSHGHDRALALYRRTLHEIARMQQQTPDAIRLDGSLRIAEDPEELEDCRVQLEAMRRDGLAAEWYEGPEGTGLRIPSDGVFQPLRRCRQRAIALATRGAMLHENTVALDISGDQVATPEGTIRCRTTIVAVDGRLEVLLPELAGRVRTARLQMVATAPTTAIHTPFAVYARYGYEYWQQLPDGGIALGGFRDRAGESEWTLEAEPGDPVQSMLDAYLRDRLGVREPVTHRWAGAVGYTENGLPVFEEVRPGVWAIGAYSGTGNVIGAICGRAVADVVTLGHSEDRGLICQ
jgi:glycine/D-amino acid oxidase-like deaminating enzyme